MERTKRLTHYYGKLCVYDDNTGEVREIHFHTRDREQFTELVESALKLRECLCEKCDVNIMEEDFY